MDSRETEMPGAKLATDAPKLSAACITASISAFVMETCWYAS